MADRINYIRQLNAFWELQGENGYIKPTSHAVYFSLLQINNTCGWKDPFLATYTQVLNMTGIANQKTYYSALEELSQKGYITWLRSKNQHQAPSFSIKVLYQISEEQLQSTVRATTMHTEEQGKSTVSIPKQENNKQENNKTIPKELFFELNGSPESVDSNTAKEVKASKELNIKFDEFWSMYDKKVGTEKSRKKWLSLSDRQRLDVVKALPNYIKSTPDKRFRKDPLTYLNGSHWQDEIISKDESFTDRPTSGASTPKFLQKLNTI